MSDQESCDGSAALFRIRKAALLGVLVLACLELMAWIGGRQLEISRFLHWVPMAPSTSACFIFLALPRLFGSRDVVGNTSAAISITLALSVIVYCVMGLVDYWGESVSYIEDRIFPAPGFLNGVPLARMSPLTAGLFVLSGGAVVLGLLRTISSVGGRITGNLPGALGSVVTFAGFTVLLGYIYGTPFLYGSATVPVAATTATAFLLLGSCVLMDLRPHDFPIRHFLGTPVQNRLVRTFVPLVFFAVVLQGIVGRFVPIFFDVNNALLGALLAGIIAVLAIIAASQAASVVGAAVDKAEENLNQAVREWELTFNTVSDLILILDNDHRIVRANEALTKKLGLSAEEVIGRHCYEVIHDEKAPPPFCPHARLLEDGKEHCAEFFEPRLGASLDGRVFPLVDEEGRIFGAVHVVRDITERKRAEEALQRSKERYRTLVDSMNEGLGVLDERGLVTYVNDRACEIVGYPREELLGHHAGDFLDDANRRKLAEEIAGRMDGEKGTYELEWTRKDGSKSVVVMSGSPMLDESGRFAGSFAVMTDITARVRSEAIQRRLATAVEQSIEAVMVTDPLGDIVYVNPAFETISGYSRDEVLGRKPTFLKSDRHDEAFYKELQSSVRSGKAWRGRLISRKKNGEPYYEDVTISPVRNAAGEIVNYVDVGHDVTQHVHLERQLVQAQKMEAVGTLAGGIAHDFNNLLQIILGYSELVQFSIAEGGSGQEEIGFIRQAAGRGAELVQQILTFSRNVETKPRPLDLNREIRQAQTMMARTIPKMISIQLALAEDLKTVNADPGQMEQVLLNLAVNAQHAMPEGGCITIRTENVILDHEYADGHFGVKPGEYALLSVSDTGHGMEKKIVDHIFEPFYTTKGPEEGTGLGLAIVFGIVKGHGGHIECYSEPGQGAIFRIYLPVIESQVSENEAITEKPPESGTETILLVDDEESILELGKRILTRAGYTVLTAGHGKVALETYRARKGEVDLIILDLIMPEMGGKECFEKLIKMDPNARIIIASGYSVDRLTKQDAGGGPAGFLGKPYRMRQMLQVVRTVLDSVQHNG
jgi:two-component system, cell cycle sensor histidine kinase and response regulator CckA